MNKVIGLLILILTITLLVISQGDVYAFADIYGILYILGTVFGVMIFSYGNQMFSVFGYLSKPVKTQKEYFLAISFFDNMANASIISGLLGTLVGQVAILSTVDSIPQLFPATAVSSLTLLYGFLLAKLIFEPFKQSIKTKAELSQIHPQIQLHLAQNNALANKFMWLGVLIIVTSVVVVALIL